MRKPFIQLTPDPYLLDVLNDFFASAASVVLKDFGFSSKESYYCTVSSHDKIDNPFHVRLLKKLFLHNPSFKSDVLN